MSEAKDSIKNKFVSCKTNNSNHKFEPTKLFGAISVAYSFFDDLLAYLEKRKKKNRRKFT